MRFSSAAACVAMLSAIAACGEGGSGSTRYDPWSGISGELFWPAAAMQDPAVAGRKPSFPALVCARLPAGITRNASNRLDDAVDAPPAASQPDAARIQAALDACPAGQAVKLVQGILGQDSFLSGPLTLPAGVSLWIDQGVTLFASRKPLDYQVPGANACGEMSTAATKGCKVLISATGSNGGLYGYGTIDGRGGAVLTSGAYANTLTWWDLAALASTTTLGYQNNPILIYVRNATNFTIFNLTLQNAPNIHVASSNTNGFVVWGARLLTPSIEYSVAGYQCPAGTTPTPYGPANLSRASTCFNPDTVKNTDGINPSESQNVLIAFNHVVNGDDGIAVKSGGKPPSTNIQILHNRLYYTMGFSIGSQTDAGVDGVSVSDLVIDGHDNVASAGFRIKTDDKAGGQIQNVAVDGLCLRRAQSPLIIDPYYLNIVDSPNQKFPDIHDIAIRNFRFQEVPGSRFTGANALLSFRGYRAQGQVLPLRNITLDNVVFDANPGWAKAGSAGTPIPSDTQFIVGPNGPVTILPVLTGWAANGVTVQGTPGSAPPYDCSNAYVRFPALNWPLGNNS